MGVICKVMFIYKWQIILFVPFILVVPRVANVIVVGVAIIWCNGVYQHSDLSSSTKYWVSFPLSVAGSSSLERNCSCGEDLCVMLLGAKMADTGSVNGPMGFDLEGSCGTSYIPVIKKLIN